MNKIAPSDLIIMRAQAARLGPDFIASLPPDVQGDRVIQKTLAREGKPLHLRPWTIEFQIARLRGIVVIAETGGDSPEHSWAREDTEMRLIEKGWTATQVQAALDIITNDFRLGKTSSIASVMSAV